MSWNAGAAAEPQGLHAPELPRLAVIGHRAWALTGSGAAITDLRSGQVRALALAGAVAVVGAGGVAWLRTPHAVHRFTAGGDALGAVAATGPGAGDGGLGGLVPCRSGDGAVVVQGARPLWIDAGGARELAPATEPVVPVIGGVVKRVGRGFAVCGEHSSIALAAPGDLAANAALCGGAVLRGGGAVGLELRSRSGHHLIVIDLATRRTTLRLRLTGTRAVIWVEDRAHAVVVRPSELGVLDLESGRCVVSRRFEEPITEAAADESGHYLVIAGARGLRVVDHAELAGSAPPPRRAGPRAVAAPVAEAAGAAGIAAEPAADAPSDAPVAAAAAISSGSASTAELAAVAEAAEPSPAVVISSGSASTAELAAVAEASPPARVIAAAAAPRASAGLAPVVAAAAAGAAGPLLLGLLPVAAPLAEAALAGFLADGFALIGGMCRRAIAEAWDSGRFGTGGVLPYADEIAATLDGADGRAPEALELARQRERAAELRFARHAAADLPLANLAIEHGLGSLAARIALVVAAPRMWPELARIYAIIASDGSRPLVDERLLAQLLGIGRADRRQIAAELGGDAPLIRHGIVVRGPGERAFAPLSVPDVIAQRLAGDRFEAAAGARATPAPLARFLAPHGRLAALCAALTIPPATPVRIVARGRSGSGRRTLAAALAATAGRRAGLVEIAPVPEVCAERLHTDLRDAALRGHLPCVSGLDTLGDDPQTRARLQRVLDDHPGPLVVRCEPGAHPPLAPGFHAIDLEGLDEVDRAVAWREALAGHGLGEAPATALATRWAVGPGTAMRAAARVAGGAGAIELDAAVRRLRADRLAGLADKVDRLADWSDLILPDDMADSLRELVARVRHRDAVLRGWGMERVSSSARAVTALFQGGPGTGKTLAAGVLARELGYDLYRVDISRVMSRWLGETEKNLARIFDAASDGETILLFDEADTLFGRRTEVKSSHDRYANVETNYLLQRLDSWTGIAILTTNFGTSIDPAFRRRLTLQLQFPFPDDHERARLWRGHLPPTVPVDGELDLAAIAARFKLSGGYIRNAALRACYLAAGAGSPLTTDHLVRAIQLEYRDMAKVAEGGRLE